MDTRKPQHPLTRRRFMAGSAAVLTATPFVFASLTHAKETAMNTATEKVFLAQDSAADVADTRIRPFTYRATDAELQDLRRRVASARLPEMETEPGIASGVPLATVQKMKDYWATKYDWRKIEARFNSMPNFLTEIDGLDIHFVHVKSKHENAMPILITHGWPGSFIEQLKLVEPLTNPTAHGGKASDAFHVVIPNMPGYGFSGKPAAKGWGPDRIARAWLALMKRLGYTRYVAQGGDWGAVVVDLMALEGDPALAGIHTNMPGVVPLEIDPIVRTGGTLPAGLSDEERVAGEMLLNTYQNVYYAFYMASRPQSLTAIADSPVGLATFLMDHDPRSLELIIRAFDGEKTGLTRDDVLDNATLFWLTNTGVSAARLYRENKFNYFTPKNVQIPVAVSSFPDELYKVPRSWAERAYPKLIHFNKLPVGGHFAAWEQPELFTEELRNGFRSLR
jgi:pimeloyl-ACP methyl ester carboxylesterase